MIYSKDFYTLNQSELDSFLEFLVKASLSKDPASKNMFDPDWPQKSHTLLFLLYKTDRFKNGQFSVIFDKGQTVACSGLYKSEFDMKFCLAGTRMWIATEYRNKTLARNFILPMEKKIAQEKGFAAMGVCFNEYNKNLVLAWQKNRLGECRSPRSEIHFGFNGLALIDFPVKIQNTKQYLLYEKLDMSYEFDWQIIRWSDT